MSLKIDLFLNEIAWYYQMFYAIDLSVKFKYIGLWHFSNILLRNISIRYIERHCTSRPKYNRIYEMRLRFVNKMIWREEFKGGFFLFWVIDHTQEVMNWCMFCSPYLCVLLNYIPHTQQNTKEDQVGNADNAPKLFTHANYICELCIIAFFLSSP